MALGGRNHASATVVLALRPHPFEDNRPRAQRRSSWLDRSLGWLLGLGGQRGVLVGSFRLRLQNTIDEIKASDLHRFDRDDLDVPVFLSSGLRRLLFGEEGAQCVGVMG